MKEGDIAKLKGRLRIFGTLAKIIELRGKYALIEITEPKGRPLRVLVDVHKLSWFPKQDASNVPSVRPKLDGALFSPSMRGKGRSE